MNPGPLSEIWGSSPELEDSKAQIEILRARAERYRRLAETLSDTGIITVVLACARELEVQAAQLAHEDNPDHD